MKNEDSKTLLYDKDCPLCDWYTGAFMKTGMLGPRGRQDYAEAMKSGICPVDPTRARHEIALIDRNGGPVLYGVDSLFYILGRGIPVLKPVFRFPPVRQAVRILYSFISYNRRIIAGKPAGEAGACAPDFHFGWRLAFILMALVLASVAVWRTGEMIGGGETTSGLWYMALACWIPMGLSTFLLSFRKQMDYLGHLATVLLVSTLFLMLGMLMMDVTGDVRPLVVTTAGGYAVSFQMHVQRRKMLGMGRRWNLVFLFTTLALPWTLNAWQQWV